MSSQATHLAREHYPPGSYQGVYYPTEYVAPKCHPGEHAACDCDPLVKSMVLIALYSVRSERQFCGQLKHNLLFRWFLDMDMDEPSFDPTGFGKNRDRMMQHEVASKFFDAVVGHARQAGLMSSEHFSVDGTLIEAWASMKSFRRKDVLAGRTSIGETIGSPLLDRHCVAPAYASEPALKRAAHRGAASSTLRTGCWRRAQATVNLTELSRSESRYP